MLVGLSGRVESFFRRLEFDTEVRPTVAMTDIIVKIVGEILPIPMGVTQNVADSVKIVLENA